MYLYLLEILKDKGSGELERGVKGPCMHTRSVCIYWFVVGGVRL